MKGVLIGVLAVIVVGFGSLFSCYNSIVTAQESISSTYADIDTQLQRRADLIPNLVSSVKGYMEHEKEIIELITQSREKLVNASTIQERADANEALTAALSQFNVVVENYPDLKASQNFIQLQDELAGTENRIATARRDYNQAVKTYNAKIRRIPGVFIARLFGFESAEYFEAAPESNSVPSVQF